MIFRGLGKKAAPAKKSRQPDLAPLVHLAPVRSGGRSLDIVVDGQVVPSRNIKLSAEIDGRIVYKDAACRSGRLVQEDGVLFRVDPRDYELEIQRIQSELDQAEFEVAELELDLENSKGLRDISQRRLDLQQTELDRLLTLEGRRVVTPSQREQQQALVLGARDVFQTQSNRVGMLDLRRRRLESVRDKVCIQLAQARLRLERTEIVSPVTGFVVEDLVEAGAFVARGTGLVVIEDAGAMEVACQIRMDQLERIWASAATSNASLESRPASIFFGIPRLPATVTFRGGSEIVSWEGYLDRSETAGIDEKTRTLPVRVRVTSPLFLLPESGSTDEPGASPKMAEAGRGASRLMRGLFVSVTLHVPQDRPLLLIPEPAIQPGNRIWRVRENRLETLIVDVVGSLNGDVQVAPIDGLLPDDRVVTSPLARVVDGMDVRSELAP